MNEEPKEWNPARTSFFVALGVPISWPLAVINLVRKPETPAQRHWLFALVALALFDILVISSVIIVGQNTKALTGKLKPEAPKSAIGVVVDDEPISEGLKVAEVTPGSPAVAGNIAVGDVIDTCDGKAVRSRGELRRCIGAHAPGEQVHLRVLRGDFIRDDVSVQTKTPKEIQGPIVDVLPKADVCEATLKKPASGPLAAWLLFVALGVFVLARRGGPSTLFLALGIGVIASLGSLSTSALCKLGVAPSVRELVELPLSPLSLFLLAFLVNRFTLQSQAPKPFSGSPEWPMTAGLAIFAHVVMLLRLAFVLGATMIVFDLAPIESTPVEEIISEGARSPAMKLLFFFTAALLAPIAEEYFFRGVAIESLTRVMRPIFAIIAVALVFGLLHGGYGVRTPIVVSLGLILGWARWDSRGLNAPIALHFAQNAVVSVLFLLR